MGGYRDVMFCVLYEVLTISIWGILLTPVISQYCSFSSDVVISDSEISLLLLSSLSPPLIFYNMVLCDILFLTEANVSHPCSVDDVSSCYIAIQS